MKRIFLLLTLTAMTLTGCKSDEQQALEQDIAQFDQLTLETMEVHDEVMPNMGQLMELSAQIDERLEQENLEDPTVKELIESQAALDQAYGDMMSWMKDYSTTFPYEAPSPATAEELEEKTPVLMEFKLAIDQIKVNTQMAIDDAQGALEKA